MIAALLIAAAAVPARPLRDVTFPRTPERVERGRYLSEGLLQCFMCHSERDWSKPGAPPKKGLKGAGRVYPGATAQRRMVAPNLTPDSQTGAGRWTDDMLARAIREGVGHDGRALGAASWWQIYRELPDDDVEAVVAYLRTLKPVKRALPARLLPAEERERIAGEPKPLAAPVRAPDISTPEKRGRFLARLADCAGCHTAWEAPLNPGAFGGGNDTMSEKNHVFSANLTQDPSGIPYYDDALFISVLRTGRLRGRPLAAEMRWTAFRNLSDGDLKAIFAYLKTLNPVAHEINNTDEPADCPRCRQKHGNGEHNRPLESERIELPAADLDAAAGRYRFASDGLTFDVTRDGTRLRATAPGLPPMELMPVGPGTFRFLGPIPGVVRAERGPDGRVARLVLTAVDEPDPAERVSPASP